MQQSQLRYDDQVRRVGELIVSIQRAHAARDFALLTQLGNRLATDSVIASALAKAETDEDEPDGTARAA